MDVERDEGCSGQCVFEVLNFHALELLQGADTGKQAHPSIHQSFRQPVISIDAPITQERPVRARDIYFLQVNRDEEVLLIVQTGFGEDLTGSPGDKTLAPELDAVAARWTFEADAVGHGDIAAVGDRMAALDEFPCVMLPGAVP